MLKGKERGEKEAPLWGDKKKREGRVTKQPAFSAPPSFPPAPLLAAKHVYPPSSRAGGPKALHDTTGLHPEERRVSCKYTLKQLSKRHIYIYQCVPHD